METRINHSVLILSLLVSACSWRQAPQDAKIPGDTGSEEGEDDGWRRHQPFQPFTGVTYTDETDSAVVEVDTGWVADLPVYECPEPPEDAIIFEIGSYNASQHFFIDSDCSCSYYFDFEGTNYVSDDATWGSKGLDDASEGEWIFDIMSSRPTACPISYQGETLMGGSQAMVLYNISWWDPDLCDGWWCHMIAGLEPGESTLCLSRVRPTRVAGTVTYYPVDPYTMYFTVPIHISFDISSHPTVPYSAFNVFFDSDLTVEDIWHGWCEEDTGL